MVEISGNIHMHTPYSDGFGSHREIAEHALRAGLDFVIVTDHNVYVDDVAGYYGEGNRRVLLLVGEEVHDVRRQPQANHCLVLGAGCGMARSARDPQGLIDAVRQAGGYTFLAHPYDPAVPAVGEADYAWYDWDVRGFTGLELWNYMSSWKGTLTSLIRVLPAVFRPERYVERPDSRTLARWDELLTSGRRVAVIGGSDGHAFPRSLGPLHVILYPYEQLFRAVNTHLLLDQPLSGEASLDGERVLNAIGQGRGWVGYDLPHPTAGFRFSAQGSTRGTMGDEVIFGEMATMQAVVPDRGNMRLLHEGQVVAAVEEDVSLTYQASRPGAYRLEVDILFEGRLRGWIYSNPIYLCQTEKGDV